MGAYLHIGFVANATTEIPKGIPLIKVLNEINNYYPAKTFTYSEQENGGLKLTLRPEVVREELVRFVKRVYKDFYGSADKPFLKNTLDLIDQELKQHDWLNQLDWLQLAQKRHLSDFSPVDREFSDCFTIEEKLLRLDTTVVFLGSEGKFLMEDCTCTLRFMETCARRSYSKFRLGTALRVVIL